MSDEPDSLTLRAMRDMRAAADQNSDLLREVIARLGRIEAGQGTARRNDGIDAEASAHAHARIDRLQQELSRINVRLGLLD